MVRARRLVALASLLVAATVYLVPACGAVSVQWRTEPFGLREFLEYYRLPGYLWPASVLAFYAAAILPLLFPRRLLIAPVRASGALATMLLFLLSILLTVWLAMTPMFS